MNHPDAPPSAPTVATMLRDPAVPATMGDRRVIAALLESMARQLGQLERIIQSVDPTIRPQSP